MSLIVVCECPSVIQPFHSHGAYYYRRRGRVLRRSMAAGIIPYASYISTTSQHGIHRHAIAAPAFKLSLPMMVMALFLSCSI